MTVEEQASDEALGRRAAEYVCNNWPELGDLVEVDSEEFATAAVVRLGEKIRDQPALFQASRRGSEYGAESLSARQFQGVLESLQNADDVRATELRVAVRQAEGRSELLIAHDGERITLEHVAAMVLPWVSTKTDDPLASGRFGIGQKTLRAMGGPIAAHCHPYRFRMGEYPSVCSAEQPIPGLYDPEAHDTLLVVPLVDEVDVSALADFVVTGLGPRSLAFLKSVRRLRFVDLRNGDSILHELDQVGSRSIPVRVQGKDLTAEVIDLRSNRGSQYTRYIVEYPLGADDRRHNKGTGPTTTLGVCVPGTAEPGSLYDRLPLPVPCSFTVSLNAQFDPDTARSALQENPWNHRRFRELGDLVAAVCLDTFARAPAEGWQCVPLLEDCSPSAQGWLSERYQEDIIAAAQRRIVKDLRLAPRSKPRTLAGIVFEEEALDTLLSAHDLQRLVPGHDALPPDWRDKHGRWRDVLLELDCSTLVDVSTALQLLDLPADELGPRPPAWFISLASAAVDADLAEELLWKASVVLADGNRIAILEEAPRALVRQMQFGTLPARLGLLLAIHPEYLGPNEEALTVRTELERRRLLVDSRDSDLAGLALLAGAELTPRVRLDDAMLVLLRDSFERLPPDQQRELGPKIGRNIELRGFSHEADGKRSPTHVTPTEAYLPVQIDRVANSFASAAKKTPGILWLSPDYARILKRAGGRKELGAQKFLRTVGAQTVPRLETPQGETRRFQNAPLGRPIRPWHLTELQRRELDALDEQARYLIGDHVSPTLDAVMADIQREASGSSRAARAGALLAALARGWDRYYADYTETQAALDDYYWQEKGSVTATWLARASSEPWMPSQTGELHPPMDLLLPSNGDAGADEGDADGYLMKLEQDLLRSDVISALRIRSGPAASDIVAKLESLRENPVTGDVETDIRRCYRALARYCPPGDSRGRRPVDDLTVAGLRTRFAGRNGRGLLWIDGSWRAPKDVLMCPAVFGRRRPFAPNAITLAPLWRTLGIQPPQPADCLDVLDELASEPLSDADATIVLETMEALRQALADVSPQIRKRLQACPLWIGDRWTTARPVYAVLDDFIAAAVLGEVAVWQPGFALDGREAFLDAIRVTLIESDQFTATVSTSRGVVGHGDLRDHFLRAVNLLRSELARADQDLYKTLAPGWDLLTAAHVVIDAELEITTTLPDGHRLVAPAAAHLLRNPLTLLARSVEDLGGAEAGGRALASLFRGDRQKLAWAWEAMWRKAEAGMEAHPIVLSSDFKEDDSIERLESLRAGAVRRKKTRQQQSNASGIDPVESQGEGESAPVQVRKLKDLARLEPTTGVLINQGTTPVGTIAMPRRLAAGDEQFSMGRNGRSGDDGGARPERPSVLPDAGTREQLAFEAVMKALALDDTQVADLRKRRGIGADAIDEFRQWFEIKMSSSAEVPNEITLTPAEVERARTDPDFFLAVVSGLEEGVGDLCVRLIFNPLGRLRPRLRGDLTLVGVREAEALQYDFPSPEIATTVAEDTAEVALEETR